MRISKKSDPGKIAGAIMGYLRSGESVDLEAIGQTSMYIADRAIIISTNILKKSGIYPTVSFSEDTKKIGNLEKNCTIYHIVGVSDEREDCQRV